MPVPVINTRAIIEDYADGVIAKILFDDIAEEGYFLVMDKQKFGEEIGRSLCESKEDVILIDDVFKKAYSWTEDIIAEIVEYAIEYIENNYEGSFVQ